MPNEAAVLANLKPSTARTAWHAFANLLDAVGEATLRSATAAGAGATSWMLSPLIERSLRELQQSGNLEAIEEIVALRDLEDDWDADGGRPATRAATDAALAIVASTYLTFRERGQKWARPSVATSGDGGVDLTWTAPTRTVLVIIYPAGGETVVCIAQQGHAEPKRETIPLDEVESRVRWAFEDV